MTGTPLLKVSDLNVAIPSDQGLRHILHDISLEVRQGEILGVIGETGSGKSLFIHSLTGELPPGSVIDGTVEFAGRRIDGLTRDELRPMLGSGIAIISSNARARLNPLWSVGRQIEAVLRAHTKVTKAEAAERVVDMLRRLGFPDAVRQAASLPNELSGGMMQRIMIAMALISRPRLVLADEPTRGLDVTVQRQVLDILTDVLSTSGTSSILVTRDLGIIAHYCDRVAVMFAGEIDEIAERGAFFHSARHPYSHELLRASFVERHSAALERVRMVDTFDFRNPGVGCRYAARCAFAIAVCRQTSPMLEAVEREERHQARCHRREEVVSLMRTVADPLPGVDQTPGIS